MNHSIILSPYDIIIIAQKTNWYDSSLFTGLIGLFGVIIGFLLNIAYYHYRELKELDRYEYMLLKKVYDILDSSEIDNNDIDKFFELVYTDLRFPKLKTMKLMQDSLDNAMDRKDYSEQKAKIAARLRKLREESFISKLIKLY